MANNNLDKLSSLPEYLLLFILSFLPFKDAVRTSILSKHWLHLWKNSKSIEFHENHNQNLTSKRFESFGSMKARRSAFMKSLEFWLDYPKEGVVEKFSLKFSAPKIDYHHGIIERCLEFVTQQGVKDLELDFSDAFWEEEVIPNKRDAFFELPRIAHENSSIESLKLSSCGFLRNGLSNFKALKEVTFGWMEVTLVALATLFSNCKMIESLVLNKCWNFSHFEIGSEASRLRRLVVHKCSFRNALFRVNVPNLCFFKYYGKLRLFEMKNTSTIKEAHLFFYLGYNYSEIGARIVYDLVKDLYNVRILSVCPYLLQVIRMGEKIRMECDLNTRHLIMKMNMLACEIRTLSFFLHSCPMLECITFELGSKIIFPDYQAMWIDSDEDQDDLPMWLDIDQDEDEPAWMDSDEEEDDDESMYSEHEDNDEVEEEEDSKCDDYCKDFINMVDDQVKGMENLILYKCLESSVKLVEMKNFVGSKNGVVFLSYLIRSGKVLKKLDINVSKGELDGNKNFYHAIEEYLMTTPRASSDLQISICY